MRVIDADELLQAADYDLDNFIRKYQVLSLINRQPTVDTVKRGKWILNIRCVSGAKFETVRCSNCGYNGNDEWKYCPNCGSLMQEVKE